MIKDSIIVQPRTNVHYGMKSYVTFRFYKVIFFVFYLFSSFCIVYLFASIIFKLTGVVIEVDQIKILMGIKNAMSWN